MWFLFLRLSKLNAPKTTLTKQNLYLLPSFNYYVKANELLPKYLQKADSTFLAYIRIRKIVKTAN